MSVSLENLKVPQLRQQLQILGLVSSGNKQVLIKSLEDFNKEQERQNRASSEEEFDGDEEESRMLTFVCILSFMILSA